MSNQRTVTTCYRYLLEKKTSSSLLKRNYTRKSEVQIIIQSS